MSDMRSFVEDNFFVRDGKPRVVKADDLRAKGQSIEAIFDYLVEDYCLLFGSPEDIKGDSLESKTAQFEGYTFATSSPLAVMLKALIPAKSVDLSNPYFTDKKNPASVNLQGVNLNSLAKKGYVYVIADTHGFENYPPHSLQYRKEFRKNMSISFIAKVEIKKEDLMSLAPSPEKYTPFLV
jgi:hypothetical protein